MKAERDIAANTLRGTLLLRWRSLGLGKAPEAFIGLFKGENFGKMLVRVGPDQAA